MILRIILNTKNSFLKFLIIFNFFNISNFLKFQKLKKRNNLHFFIKDRKLIK